MLAKAVTLTMVFSACRLGELARMTISPEQITPARLTVGTSTKTALGELQMISILPVADTTICPYAALLEWLKRRGTQTALLFTHPSTDTPLSAIAIARMLREVMTRAGIAESYGAYSIKHAVITYLYSMKVEEVQINEFGRWSLTSRVPGAYYRVATGDKNWLGYCIAGQ
jgi:integrase